ncbi:MAG: gamma-glutamyl-gamma-aminobutyrate hydrolase family protein [Deltaproteobacteria bacterium]|nr:gamma-glutamyl-gamma-aminobutyrate hydrolase family protein [Deltaproteobacteria bacterium]
MKRRLLIISTGNIPQRFGLNETFAEMFVRLGKLKEGTYSIFDATCRRGYPKDPHTYSGYIITGSLSMVTYKPLWSLRLIDFIKKLKEKEAPFFGVCYGHQIVAAALGGQVDFHPQGMELGSFWVNLTEAASSHPLTTGLPKKFLANLSHSQSVLKAPYGSELLGTTEHDKSQILSYGPNALTVQFHPEFDGPVMEAFAKGNDTSESPQKSGQNPKTPQRALKLGLPIVDTPESVELLGRFVHLTFKETANPQKHANFAF